MPLVSCSSALSGQSGQDKKLSNVSTSEGVMIVFPWRCSYSLVHQLLLPPCPGCSKLRGCEQPVIAAPDSVWNMLEPPFAVGPGKSRKGRFRMFYDLKGQRSHIVFFSLPPPLRLRRCLCLLVSQPQTLPAGFDRLTPHYWSPKMLSALSAHWQTRLSLIRMQKRAMQDWNLTLGYFWIL